MSAVSCCAVRLGCSPWKLKTCQTLGVILPVWGFFHSAVCWKLSARHVAKIDDSLRIGERLGPPTPVYPPVESSENSQTALLAGGESPRGGDYRHPGNEILKLQRPILLAQKANYRALFITHSLAYTILALYVAYRMDQL